MLQILSIARSFIKGALHIISKIILFLSVAGLGIRGDQVSVKRSLFRSRLLPGGLAVYASPENVEAFAKEKAVRLLFISARLFGYFLSFLMLLLGDLYFSSSYFCCSLIFNLNK